MLTDGEVDSEPGDKYSVITLNARKIAPLRLPDSRLTNTGDDPTMATLVKQWIMIQHPNPLSWLELEGETFTVYFTDGYSGKFVVVSMFSDVYCTYIPGSLEDKYGNRPGRTPAATVRAATLRDRTMKRRTGSMPPGQTTVRARSSNPSRHSAACPPLL